MACPFLKEGRARYCHAAPVQKLILDGPGAADGGRCASPQYGQCEFVAKKSVQQNRCPHLEEIRVQYCGVSAVTKLVPFQRIATLELHEQYLPLLRFVSVARETSRDQSARASSLHAEPLLVRR